MIKIKHYKITRPFKINLGLQQGCNPKNFQPAMDETGSILQTRFLIQMYG